MVTGWAAGCRADECGTDRRVLARSVAEAIVARDARRYARCLGEGFEYVASLVGTGDAARTLTREEDIRATQALFARFSATESRITVDVPRKDTVTVELGLRWSPELLKETMGFPYDATFRIRSRLVFDFAAAPGGDLRVARITERHPGARRPEATFALVKYLSSDLFRVEETRREQRKAGATLVTTDQTLIDRRLAKTMLRWRSSEMRRGTGSDEVVANEVRLMDSAGRVVAGAEW
jgi:hypothetical protein